MSHSERQSSVKSQLDAIQRRAEELASASSRELAAMRVETTKILTALQEKDYDDDSSSSEIDDLEANNRLSESLEEINTKLDALKDRVSTIPKETQLLQQLRFNYMFSRVNSISDVSEGTFAWIMMTDAEFVKYCVSRRAGYRRASIGTPSDDDGTSTEDRDESFVAQSRSLEQDSNLKKMNNARQLLQSWLKGGNTIFHISGKAGSGKSTLMKFICRHSQKTKHLAEWAGSRELAEASFFFWQADQRALQMSLDGLYRSILFAVLCKCPGLIEKVFSEQWRAMHSTSTEIKFEDDLFEPDKIQEAFETLMMIPVESEKYAFCFFIDGLDEYEAKPLDQKLLAQKFQLWSAKSTSKIKLCVSSRPNNEFQDTFQQYPRINLHDLTAYDIYRSSRNMFEKNNNLNRVKDIYIELVEKVVEMAEGVFLWAHLVVKSLNTEVDRHASPTWLRQKLLDTPRELDRVYVEMLRPLSRQERKLVDYIILLTLSNPFRSPMNAICLAWVLQGALPPADFTYADVDVLPKLDDVRRQIQGLTKDLLVLAPDTTGLGQCPMFCQRVQLFHRTARNYLEAPEQMSKLGISFTWEDSCHAHSFLRLAEMALVNVWNVPHVSDLEQYAFEPLALRASSGRPFQQTFAHMKLLKEIWTHHFGDRLRFQSLQKAPTIPLSTAHTSSCLKVSFLALAAWWGQLDFLRSEMDQFDPSTSDGTSLLDTELGVKAIYTLSTHGYPNVLLSACCGWYGDPEMASLLLAKGFSTRSSVRLVNSSNFRVEQDTNVWMAFIAYLSSQAFSYPLGVDEEHLHRLFQILQLFLEEATQDRVVICVADPERAKADYITGFTYISQLVLWRRPPNTNHLLELLGAAASYQPDEGGKQIAIEVLQHYTASGMAGVPGFLPAHKLSDLNLRGIASSGEWLIGLENLSFQMW